MKNAIQLLPAFLLSLLLGLSMNSCVEKDFDEPPADPNLPNITANATLADLKEKHVLGEFEEIEEDMVIEGVVVADDESGNYYRALVIQDGSGGILMLVNFNNLYTDYPIGRKVYIKAKGLWLGDYNGLVQLGGGTYDDDGEERLGGIEEALVENHLIKGQTGQTITPTVVSINDLTTDVQDPYLSTLVQIDDIQFTDAMAGLTFATYDAVSDFRRSENRDLVDCDGNAIILRSSGFAEFVNELLPEGKGSIMAIYSVFGDDRQLVIRDTNDVQMQGNRCGSVGFGEEINEGFNGSSNNEDIATPDWKNIAVKGGRLWRGKEFGGNLYAQATAFGDSAPEMETWLITPPIDLSKLKVLRFESAQAFWVHDGLSIWIATDFNGADVAAANWTELNARLATNTDAEHAWVPSGDVDLSDFSGTGHVGFKYVGDAATNTSSYRIDNVMISEE